MQIIDFSDANLSPVKVSIVMPVGRVDEFLPTTLDSIAQQDFRDFELVIVCRLDIYQQVLDAVCCVDRSIPCQVIATKLAGVAFAANLGISYARGEYIARWDSDDLCDSTRLSRQVDELQQDKSLGVVGTRVIIVDEAGKPNKFHSFKFYQTNEAIRHALKYRQPLLHSALMFRAQILLDVKGYLYGHTSEDHEMFIRIARNKAILFKNLPDVTTYYRRHSLQLSDVAHLNNHFYEISGFMLTEFLRSWNPLYIFGALVYIPLLRRVRHLHRAMRTRLGGA